ncbi:hypothetical protein [Hafnia paralvei]|uniref:hypothetical protein n=1 Tax=Hafnia paralvei TaxID=546367 RepID=UPI00241EDDFF|nr:hypothetical protein [Hafnia paralvei]
MKKIAFIILVLVIVTFVFFWFQMDSESDDSATVQDNYNIDNTLVQKSKKAVIKSLKDPDSAMFDAIYPSKSFPRAACGSVNAKNSYGGYTGSKRFIATPDTGGLTFEGDDKFDERWENWCKSSSPKILLN